jgi:hypothetical protein
MGQFTLLIKVFLRWGTGSHLLDPLLVLQFPLVAWVNTGGARVTRDSQFTIWWNRLSPYQAPSQVPKVEYGGLLSPTTWGPVNQQHRTHMPHLERKEWIMPKCSEMFGQGHRPSCGPCSPQAWWRWRFLSF